MRPVPDYAAGHVPAVVSIPLRPTVRDSGWAGWLHPSVPLVVVRDPDQDLDEVVWQA